MMKVLSIFGTRPEAIKMAPVIRELDNANDRIVSRVCVTAQHREMLDQVLSDFSIRPDHDLDIMRQGQSPSQVAAAVLAKLEPVLAEEKPDWVFVQGDTTTTMAASIAAFHGRIKVGHIEAGLRTHDKTRPFPEEANRLIAGVLADLHFAPTRGARQNLLNAKVAPDAVVVTGNTVIDALRIMDQYPADMLARLNLDIPWQKRILLVTTHRRESLGEPLESICMALRSIAGRFHDSVHIVIPVHRNRHVRDTVHRLLVGVQGITLIEPLDYLPFVQLLKRSFLVLTDSGGLQEEAPWLGKPVLVLRDVTERSEAVETGVVKMVGTGYDRVLEEATTLLTDDKAYRGMARRVSPYGDGFAARRIVNAVLQDRQQAPVNQHFEVVRM